MKDMSFSEAVERSVQIRKLYHQLEMQNHEKEWTVEEDALAFLTDAGLVGRLTIRGVGRQTGNLYGYSHEFSVTKCNGFKMK